ncbi:putative GNAT family acetyltransferase [Aequitasia blattaphilus]|uniref:N-acetyltransferase n=1 Tax=Aequitasia blattaphilus TaxID=2949332 RepID=A0ABT1E9Y8_9FIRM|nr:GNAT family N-acetyltransferase [Aequitasia blattaphilus]MCP1102650.1 N-acetyltransferase [Aequitasia blattaphilus]MCR8615290.1 N-acetyltransferase [Aequitasia blattaphilus]
MKIEHKENLDRFLLKTDEGEKIGEIEYRVANDSLIYVTRTEVSPEHGGKGYAGLLLDALVEWARKNNIKAVPICSYVVRAFEKNPDKYGDIAILK